MWRCCGRCWRDLWNGRAVEVTLRLLPGFHGDEAPQQSSSQVGTTKMNTSIAAGHSGLVGGVAEGLPFQFDPLRWRYPRFDLGTACWKRYKITEPVASRPQCQNSRPCRAIRAVARDVVGKRRRGKSRCLIRNPARAVYLDRALAGASPTSNRLAFV